MREIQASDAKARLPQLLDEVERGETLVITRHGRAIARIVPEVVRRQEEIGQAIDGIQRLRVRTGKISVSELLSARDEGRS
jgi:prevent-host-death family protein